MALILHLGLVELTVSRRRLPRSRRALDGLALRPAAQALEQALDRGADFGAGGSLVLCSGNVQRPFAERCPQDVRERFDRLRV